ncbi:MAG: hypothetical protein ACREA2_00260 [Blastocatellia bacterium]
MKKRMASTLPLLLAAGAFLFSACSRNSGTVDTGANAPGAATATASPSAPSQEPNQSLSQTPDSSQAAKSGWWIRINPSATTAQVITFQIGTSKLQREEWRVWNAGEPAEFALPEKYSQVPRLYVRGNVTPIGRFATLCVMYKGRGVEHMSFDDDDSETMSQAEIDIKCR